MALLGSSATRIRLRSSELWLPSPSELWLDVTDGLVVVSSGVWLLSASEVRLGAGLRVVAPRGRLGAGLGFDSAAFRKAGCWSLTVEASKQLMVRPMLYLNHILFLRHFCSRLLESFQKINLIVFFLYKKLQKRTTKLNKHSKERLRPISDQ